MNIELSITQTLTSIAQNYNISVEELKQHMPQAVNLLIFPLFHVSGLLAMFLANLISGGKLVLLNRWDVNVLLGLIEQEKISMVSGVPSMYWELLAALQSRKTDLSSLRTISCGGQAFPPNLIAALQEVMPDVILATGYGMTETSGVIASVSGEAFLRAPTGSGKIFPIIDVRIADENGEALPPHKSGEICVRGPLVMQGYYKQKENDAKALRDGWLHTGDLGYVDEAGYLYVSGRKKDMIICNGENIYCAEIEQKLTRHPDIRLATAFGVPDDRAGERLVVLIGTDNDALTIDDVKAHAQESLAAYQMPSEIILGDEMIRYNETGKINKNELRERFMKRENL